MVAERDIEVGEELSHLYALAPSSELLASYGFVPPGGARGFEEAVVEPWLEALKISPLEVLFSSTFM